MYAVTRSQEWLDNDKDNCPSNKKIQPRNLDEWLNFYITDIRILVADDTKVSLLLIYYYKLQ